MALIANRAAVAATTAALLFSACKKEESAISAERPSYPDRTQGLNEADFGIRPFVAHPDRANEWAEFAKGFEATKEVARTWRRELAQGESISLRREQSKLLAELITENEVLAFGEVSERVALLQALLVSAGALEARQVDGIYGSGTRAAVKKFQMEHVGVVTYDGESASWRTFNTATAKADFFHADAEFARRFAVVKPLFSTIAEREGREFLYTSTGFESPDIEARARILQSVLKELGYYRGPITGRIGTQTWHAVAEFRKRHQIDEPKLSKIGPRSLRALVRTYMQQGDSSED